MTERNIYVVWGTTGEYSDHREWIVKAFTDEKAAQRLVVEAQARANEIKALKDADWDAFYEARYGDSKQDATVQAKYTNEFDPQMELDYTGTDYSLGEVVLVEGSDEKTN